LECGQSVCWCGKENIMADDDDRAIAEARQAWQAPWESRRGVFTTDYNNSVTLIRASIDAVAGALAERTQRWERDVLGREIVLGGESAFVFRLRGHTWTELVVERLKPSLLVDPGEQVLSRRLATPVIAYSVSDTTAAIGYDLYDKGELLEKFSAVEGDDSADNMLWSRHRDLKLSDVTDIWDFARSFLIEQDAFDPGFDFDYFVGRRPYKPGDRLTVVNPGFTLVLGSERLTSTPPIERVDYLALKPGGG